MRPGYIPDAARNMSYRSRGSAKATLNVKCTFMYMYTCQKSTYNSIRMYTPVHGLMVNKRLAKSRYYQLRKMCKVMVDEFESFSPISPYGNYPAVNKHLVVFLEEWGQTLDNAATHSVG